MRRQLAVLGTVLIMVGGCTFDRVSHDRMPTVVDPSAAASADQALAGDTQAICDQAARTGASFGQTFIQDLQLQVDSVAQGDTATARAEQKIARDVQNYSVALADMAALTPDAALKNALDQMSKQVTALKGDLTKINTDKMARIGATLDEACGKS